MAVKQVQLEPGWLKKTLDDVAAHERGQDKIIAASDNLRRSASYAPLSIDFTEAEIHALAYMAKCMRPTRS
jgi:hypothetical protein